MALEFEWDEDKARANYAKHGVAFEEGIEVFLDMNAVTIYDKEHSILEDRFRTIGRSHRLRLLRVVHCERGERIRIISTRKATPNERSIYESQDSN